jgi:hypothetical protein
VDRDAARWLQLEAKRFSGALSDLRRGPPEWVERIGVGERKLPIYLTS